MVKSKVLIVTFSLMALQGCAAVALTAGSMAADAGIEHTLYHRALIETHFRGFPNV